ncbi:hypothetical protein [Acetobacter estunensis]|uniref:hypothetical protein n=1 Tax=Acetobacter estunensis TaxID=104097 RepID=UPI001407ACC0|nr:hypothetical protein [Acetobacter estunensis]
MSRSGETSRETMRAVSRPPSIVVGHGASGGRSAWPYCEGKTMIVVIVVDRKWLKRVLRKTKKALQAVGAVLKSLSE